jgi:hypothetical protein
LGITENNMADGINLAQQGTLPPELYAQQQALNRQQQLATMLMQQNQQPQGQMVSGRYVPTSFFQNLQPVANMLTGAYLAKQGDTKAAELAQKLREGRSSAEEKIIQQMTGTPAQATEMAGPYGQNVNRSGMNVPMPVAVQPAVAPDLAGALREIRTNPYGAGKEYTPAIIKQMLPEPIKPTNDMQNYEFAKTPVGGGFKGSFNDFKNQITPYQEAQLGIDRERFEFDKSQKGAGKDLTESQGKASAFQSQMVSASNAVNTLEGQGFDPTSLKSQTAVRLAGGVTNPLIPVAAQQYKQAQDQWSEAYLRFKTGAAATEPEVVRNNRTFFPVFGDKPEQIAQKAAAREQAQRDIGIAAGRGANLGAQAIGQQPKQPSTPTGLPSQSAIDAELKRRGL